MEVKKEPMKARLRARWKRRRAFATTDQESHARSARSSASSGVGSGEDAPSTTASSCAASGEAPGPRPAPACPAARRGGLVGRVCVEGDVDGLDEEIGSAELHVDEPAARLGAELDAEPAAEHRAVRLIDERRHRSRQGAPPSRAGNGGLPRRAT